MNVKKIYHFYDFGWHLVIIKIKPIGQLIQQLLFTVVIYLAYMSVVAKYVYGCLICSEINQGELW